MTPAPDPARVRYRTRLFTRFFVRFHVALLLGAVVAGGIALNRLLLEAGLTLLPARALAVCVLAYGLFLALTRLWLAYVHASDTSLARLGRRDLAEAAPEPPRRAPRSGTLPDLGGFEAPDDGPVAAILFGVVLLVLAVVVLWFLGAWLLVDAPLMLAEAAFQVALSASLVRASRRLDAASGAPGWLRTLLACSWRPFVVVLLVTAAVATIAHVSCDGAPRLAACFTAE